MRVRGHGLATGSVIPHGYMKKSIAAKAFDPYRASFRPEGDRVMNSIFGQSLHRKGQDLAIERLRVGLQVNVQPVLVTKLLEGQVFFREVVFLRKFDQVVAVFSQRVSEEITQAFDGAFRDVWAKLH